MTQIPNECRSPARKRTTIRPAQHQLTQASGRREEVNPFLNFEDEGQAYVDRGESEVPEESLPIEEEDGEHTYDVGEEHEGQEDEGGPGLYIGEQDNEEQERENTHDYMDEDGVTQQVPHDTDGYDGYAEHERGFSLEPEQTQAIEIEGGDEKFDGSEGAQTDIDSGAVATPRTRQYDRRQPAPRLPTATWEDTPMEIDEVSSNKLKQILYYSRR